MQEEKKLRMNRIDFLMIFLNYLTFKDFLKTGNKIV
jgi:hypothetical protein